MYVSHILSALALTLSAACLALTLAERRRLKGRFEAVLHTIGHSEEQQEKKLAAVGEEVTRLKNGLCPDYEAAREAADSLNGFNKGLTAIFGYDPFEAVKAAREESAGDVV